MIATCESTHCRRILFLSFCRRVYSIAYSCRWKKHGKRRDLEHNTSDTVVQNLPRSNLFDCLEAHWETLKVEGIFAILSRQVFMWTQKVIRNKSVDYIIISFSVIWTLKTIFINGGDQLRRCEISTVTPPSLPKLEPNKGFTNC